MNKAVRDRLLLPVAIPLGAIVLILTVVFIFSRVLLNVPHQMAVAVAIVVAINILVVCGVLATRKRLGAVDILPLFAVAAVPLFVAGAVIGGLVEVEDEDHDGPPKAVIVEVSAENIAFGQSELHVPAGSEFTIRFTNKEAVPHNFALYTSPEADSAIFQGDIFAGPATRDFRIGPLEPGTYFFRCDVHPTEMTGTVVAEAGPPPGPPSETKVAVVARNIAFDVQEITVAAGAVTIEFENAEAVPHNIAVYKTPEAKEQIFEGEIFGGPARRIYRLTIPEPGSYFFRCDVHPAQMTGTLIVE